MRNKLIILSGGMDSTTLLYDQRNEIEMGLVFYYGQKHCKEIDSAFIISDKISLPLYKIDLHQPMQFMRSALTEEDIDIPEGHYEDESMKQTVVPFRNGIMLSIAVGIAESNGLKTVLYGAHRGDHAIYPDCRVDFFNAFQIAAERGTHSSVTIEAPFLSMTKREIGLKGKILNVPFEKTWSCYKGEEYHCGKCGTCVERKEALKGFDPTMYADDHEDIGQ